MEEAEVEPLPVRDPSKSPTRSGTRGVAVTEAVRGDPLEEVRARRAIDAVSMVEGTSGAVDITGFREHVVKAALEARHERPSG